MSTRAEQMAAEITGADHRPLSVLEEADNLINGERNQQYGSAKVAFTRYAAGWSQILGIEVTPKQVALCMLWLKIGREVNRPKRDNLTDMAGYIGLAEQIDRDD